MRKKETQTEKEAVREIISGRYKHAYLIYNRKSTDEADNQKNSISYQRSENSRYAAREHLAIADISVIGFCTDGVISEKHSGFKEDFDVFISDDGVVQYRIDRPKFQKMLQLVSQGHFKGVICLCWDRISRNKGDDTIIRKLMRRGVDFRFVYATYDNTSSGALHMDIDGMFSQHHSRVTSEKVTLATRNNRERGICTYRAPIGYLNVGSMTNKPLDPVRAPIIKRMFELYATGDWSLSDLARFAGKQGLTTVPMRRRRTPEQMLDENYDLADLPKVSRPLTENHVSRILTNRFYTGRVLDPDGRYIPSASHQALVDDDLFDRVQGTLHGRQVSIHYTDKLDQPLRGIVRCAYCHRVYTPYVKKGIQYYNSRCVGGCRNTLRNVNFNLIAGKAGKLLSGLYFTEDELAQMDARLDTEIALLEERRHRECEQIERAKRKIREDLAYLRANKLPLLKTGVYTPESLIAEEDKLETELAKLHRKEEVSDAAMHDTMEEVQNLSELIKNLIPYYEVGKPREKEQIIRKVFSELRLSQDTLEYSLKKSISFLSNRIFPIGGQLAWLSELAAHQEEIVSYIRDLKNILQELENKHKNPLPKPEAKRQLRRNKK
jgi:DNA invertase Pin-like site-specific DNA recombinase